MTPFTDIVIPVRGTGEFQVENYLQTCISTLVKYTSDYRLIFVDDNSDQAHAAALDSIAGSFSTSVVIRTNRQNWFSRAVNKGLHMVRTPKAVVLNCDTVLDEGWLDELYDVWAEVEQQTQQAVGLVGSLLNPDMTARWRCTVPPHYVTAHCILLSMEAGRIVANQRGTPGEIFDEVNPLCIHIRSDIELSHRLNAMGLQTVESFRSKVGHHGGKSWGHLLGSIPSSIDEVKDL